MHAIGRRARLTNESIGGLMKVAEVRKEIAACLKEQLEHHGFKVKSGTGGVQYRRPIDGGRHQISISLANYEPDYVYSLVAGVRFDRLVEIDEEIDELPEPDKYRDQALSLTVDLDYFSGKRRHEFSVSSAEEIRASINELLPVIESKIIPFLDGCRTIEDYDRLVNPVDLNNPVVPEFNQITAVVVAKLVRNPNFNRVLERARQAPDMQHKMHQELLDRALQILDRIERA